jgi:sensory rhodopsin
MINIIFIAGMSVFFVSGIYFYFLNKKAFNSALLICLITLVSYILMWQGSIKTISLAGEPIFWSRWLFYIGSCTLLMFEISRSKKMKVLDTIELMILTAIVMFTGFLAAWNITDVKWVYFAVSSIAYILLLIKILSARTEGSGWINFYIYFGWTLFPVVFILAPTGIGLIGPGLSSLLYLILDIFTKIVFSMQLIYKKRKEIQTVIS